MKINKFFKRFKFKFRVPPMTFYFHPLFFLVGIGCVFMGLLAMFLMMTLLAVFHELAHAVTAFTLGYKLNKVCLMPFGAELSGEDDFLPEHEIIVALAGPIFNFVVCIICVAIFWLLPESYAFFYPLCISSLVFGVFNLLPFFPLDGGRVVLGVLGKRGMQRKISVKLAKVLTISFSIFLFIVFILTSFVRFNLTFGIVAVMLFCSCLFENENMAYKRITALRHKESKLEKGILVRRVLVREGMSPHKLFLKLSPKHYTIFVLVDSEFNVVKEIDEAWVEKMVIGE